MEKLLIDLLSVSNETLEFEFAEIVDLLSACRKIDDTYLPVVWCEVFVGQNWILDLVRLCQRSLRVLSFVPILKIE